MNWLRHYRHSNQITVFASLLFNSQLNHCCGFGNDAIVGHFVIMNGTYWYRILSKSAKLANVRTVRCFSAFAPTGLLFILYSNWIAAKFDGKKIDPNTPWSKSFLFSILLIFSLGTFLPIFVFVWYVPWSLGICGEYVQREAHYQLPSRKGYCFS